jgi:hypothetical protein
VGFKLKKLTKPSSLRRIGMAIGTGGASEAGRAIAGPGNQNLGMFGMPQTGGPLGAFAGSRVDQSTARDAANAPQTGVVPKARPGGMTSYYNDSWKQLQDTMSGGGGYEDAISKILANFQGKPSDLENFMRQAQPFMGAIEAGNMRNSAAYKQINDPNNWDMGAEGAYGPAAGQMARSSQRGVQTARAGLAAQGLGRGAGGAAIASGAANQLGEQQSNLWATLHQQAQQNRMQSAGNALDAHRMIAQMALGQQITPRVEQGNSTLQQAMMLAQGVGGIAGGVGSLASLGGKA